MAQFVAIEGLIGVGKTSLCRILESERSARLVLEPCDDNPFLASFYADPDRFAFPAQMFYLASRFSQQMNLRQLDLFSDLIVSDYLWEKDRLFAEETLVGDEMSLYDRFSSLLQGSIEEPDFVLFLDSPTEVVQDRIARRSREGEDVIGEEYLDSLRDRYYQLWARYTAAPVYVIDTSEIHYVDSEADKDYMLRLVDGWLSGRPIAGAPTPYKAPSQQLTMFG
ncbi:MAG: deoxynucleoside kinase [Myxococcota bacterium]|nr:deoxynucleoside kinase [Myxococcota bacterium]MEC9388559.1 deoxynucleoside kinase [Myxococcota bacterium]